LVIKYLEVIPAFAGTSVILKQFLGETKMESRKGFTLIELMVVILIVGILAAVAVPIMRGRIDTAKWSEANASAGSIRTSIRAYIAEKGPNYDAYATDLHGGLDDSDIQSNLGFSSSDLDGAYFDQEDYVISEVTADPPSFIITVGPSEHDGAPPGTGTMATDGSWSVSTE
jgi:prepilin-type N-terminal cleavage/methylation domain-containing protein